jgi:hypothetical protein
MKTMNAALAAAALALAATTIGTATPADAQVSIRAGDSGVGVRIGDGHRDGHHHRHYTRGYYAYGQADCRTVVTRKYRPNGTVVITRKRICD